MLLCIRSCGINLIRNHRFNHFSKSISYINHDEGEKSRESRTNEVSRAFGCSYTTARLMVNRVDALRLGEDEFYQVMKFCQKYLKLSDVAEHPNIITVPFNLLNHRFHALKEIGFQDIRGRYLLDFSRLMSQRPKKLEKSGIRLQFKKSLSSLFDSLSIPNEQRQCIQNKVMDLYTKNHELSTIRTKLTEDFLLWRLKCSKSKLDKMLKFNALLLLQSVREIDATINVLTKEYDFALSTIMNESFLLTLDSGHLEDILKTVPEILDIDIKVLAGRKPEVLREFAGSLIKNRDILKQFNFSTSQLMSYLKVLRLKPNVLRHRIECLLNSPDFSLFRDSNTFLKLVYHQKNLNHRLKLLKDSELPFSISMLTVGNNVFMQRLKQCHRQNYAKDIVHYLSELYKCSKTQVRRQLKTYPQFYSSSVLGAYKVIDFLLSKGVSKEQLWHGLGIIGYSPEVVQQYFVNIQHNPEFQPMQEWVVHFNFVQLLIYAIERNLYSSRPLSDVGTVADASSAEDSEDIFEDDEDDEEEDIDIFDAYKL